MKLLDLFPNFLLLLLLFLPILERENRNSYFEVCNTSLYAIELYLKEWLSDTQYNLLHTMLRQFRRHIVMHK